MADSEQIRHNYPHEQGVILDFSFLASACELLFKQSFVSFAVRCGIYGALVAILDLISYFIKDKSLLNMDYQGYRYISIPILWAIGSSILGFLAASINIPADTITGSVSIAIGWPYVYKQIIDGPGKNYREDRSH